MVYTTFVLDCGSVRMTLVDGDVTLFLPAPSACPRELVPISRPAWTPSAASLQNPYLYVITGCQRDLIIIITIIIMQLIMIIIIDTQ